MGPSFSKSIVVMGMALGVASCGHGNQSSPGDSSKSTQPVLTSEPDQAAGKKVQQIVECWNTPVMGLISDADRYEREFRPLMKPGAPVPAFMPLFAGTTLFQGSFEDQNKTGDLSRACAAKLDAAARSGPAIADIDQAAPKVAAALRQLIAPANAFDVYLDQKIYLDDHWAKGRALDTQLTPLLAQISMSGNQMYKGMQAEKALLDQHRLDAIEKQNGQSLDWHAERTRIAARNLLEKTEALAKNSKLDSVIMEKLITDLQREYDAAQASAKTHPELLKFDPQKRAPLWPALESSISDELSKARDLRRTLAEPNTDPESHADSIRRGVENVESSYNSLVFAYNQNQN